MAGEMAHNSSADAEVTHCVSNLVHAFSNGLSIFKRLREKRRKRKTKHKSQGDSASNAELQLSNSLRQGPRDIKERYDMCYGEKGERFARGDAIAHASLAETLIKLNTGLVGIIAAFLNHDSKSSHLHLDYKSLTSLSDASRQNAVDSLNQLYQRLSHSQLQLHRMAGGGPKATDAAGEKRRRNGSKQRSGSGPTVARVALKSSNETQLAFVRPKNTRKGSSSSGSSTKSPSPSTAVSSAYTSPVHSPLPQYSPRDPYPPQKVPAVGRPSNNASSRRPTAPLDTAAQRPNTWPYTHHPSTAIPSYPPTPPPKIPLSSRKTSPQTSSKEKEKHRTSSPPPSAGLPRRRTDKVTPSTYTFASDSTKLGEIPQARWNVPWDYEEAERLNAQAVENGYVASGGEAGGKARKKGLFGFLRRGPGAGAA